MRTILSFLLICSSFSIFLAQEKNPPAKVLYSTFILGELSSREQCKTIDNSFRNMEGVIASRTDLNTRRYFIVYSNPNFNLNWFKSHFEKTYGLKITCYNSGIQGVDRPVFNTYQSCNEQ